MMRFLTFSLFCLCAAANAAVPVSSQQRWLNQLSQPIAVAWNAEQRMALLDLRGLHFGQAGTAGTTQANADAGSSLDVAASAGGWWLADPAGQRLLQLNADGKLLKSWPAQQLMLANEERGKDDEPLKTPQPVAVAATVDTLFWADRANHRICRFDLVKQTPLNCFGKRGEGEGEFQYPYQMLFDRDGYLYVTDILNARVQIFDQTGRFFSQIGRFGTDALHLYRPNGIAMDQEHDLLFVSDSYFGRITVFKAGEALGALTDAEGREIRLQSPTGLSWHDGQLFVAETLAGNILSYRIAAESVQSGPDALPESSDNSQKNCLICHLSWSKNPDANRLDEQGMQPDSANAMCYSCHNGAILDSRQRIGQGSQHASIYDDDERKHKRHEKERKDKLPDEFPRTHDKELPCTSCHTPHTRSDHHDTLYAENENAWLRTPNKGGDMCERCHESKIKQAREKDYKKRGLNHPLAIKLAKPPVNDAPGYASEANLQKGLPKSLQQAGGAAGHQDELVCQSCHQIHGGYQEDALALMPLEKGQLCADCHQRQSSKNKKDARHKGVHPVNIKPDKPMKQHDKAVKFVTCQTCHKVHDGQTGTPLLEKDTDDVNALCESCHQRQHAKDKDDAIEKGIHPVNIKLDDPVEIAGEKIERIQCLSCHAVHDGKPDTPALVEDHRNGQLCSHCHAGKQAVVGSDHDLRVTDKKRQNHFEELPTEGVCGACHTLHKGKAKQRHLYAAKMLKEDRSDPEADRSQLKEDRLCLNCHQKDGSAEKKVVKHFSHPHRDLILRSDKKVMPLLDKQEKVEEFGEIACITCHDPHFWTPELLAASQKQPEQIKPLAQKDNVEGTPLNSFLRTSGVKGTFCVDCHGLEALTKFKYFHDKEWARDKALDYLE